MWRCGSTGLPASLTPAPLSQPRADEGPGGEEAGFPRRPTREPAVAAESRVPYASPLQLAPTTCANAASRLTLAALPVNGAWDGWQLSPGSKRLWRWGAVEWTRLPIDELNNAL